MAGLHGAPQGFKFEVKVLHKAICIVWGISNHSKTTRLQIPCLHGGTDIVTSSRWPRDVDLMQMETDKAKAHLRNLFARCTPEGGQQQDELWHEKGYIRLHSRFTKFNVSHPMKHVQGFGPARGRYKFFAVGAAGLHRRALSLYAGSSWRLRGVALGKRGTVPI